jgi:hypothetical protein
MVGKIKIKSESAWHLLDAYFSREDGIEPASIDGVPVLVPGKLGDVPVIQVPASATPEMLDRISKAVIEACSMEPFIITSNVQLLRFKKIDERTAMNMMAKTKAKLEKLGAERERIEAEVDAKNGDGNGPLADGERASDADAGQPARGTESGRVDAAESGQLEESSQG